jgi:hypothetical protein
MYMKTRTELVAEREQEEVVRASLLKGDITEGDHPFRDLVVRDAKFRHDDLITPEEREYLRSPEVCEHWRDTLIHLRREMEAQFSERKAAAERFQTECFARGYSGKADWFEYKAEYDEWRARGNRFTTMIAARLDEAKRITKENRAPSDIERCKRLLYEALKVLGDEEGARDTERLVADIAATLQGQGQGLSLENSG